MSDSPSPSAASAPDEPEDIDLPGGGENVPGGARKGRGWRIGLMATLAVVLVLVVGVGAVGLWVRHTLSSNIETIPDPFASLPTRAPQQQVADGQQPATNILVLGSDSRISAGDPQQWQAGAQRTDAMMLIQISGDRQDMSVMSIPRDSWVNVPGHGLNKINAAYSFGGPGLTIQTVEELTGVHIHHFAIADFESFKTLTDEIGGVTLDLKTEQTLAGTDFPAGPQHLNGEQALDYARERKSLPGGDFDRVRRQQAWMKAILSQALNNGTLTDPTKLYGFLKVATSTMAVDEGFTVDEMQSLALSMRNMRAGDINFMTVPTSGTGTSDDGQSIVLLDEAADAPLFEAFRNDAVREYLQENADAVDLLPDEVN